MRVKHLDHLNLTVTNVDESISWYGRCFGFEAVERGSSPKGPWAILRSGDALLCIYEQADHEHLDRFRRGARGLHGVNHFAFRIDEEQPWLDTIDREGLEVAYGGVVDWANSKAWYVTDPTGYEIEVALWVDDRIAFD